MWVASGNSGDYEAGLPLIMRLGTKKCNNGWPSCCYLYYVLTAVYPAQIVNLNRKGAAADIETTVVSTAGVPYARANFG